jgi:hypothetical protein
LCTLEAVAELKQAQADLQRRHTTICVVGSGWLELLQNFEANKTKPVLTSPPHSQSGFAYP